MKKLIILFISVFSLSLYSQKYANEFLKIGVGGKYLATGGALSSTATDPASVFYNAGAVGAFDRVTVSAMHNAYFAGVANFDYAGIIFPFKYKQNIGVSLIRFGVDNIPNTTQLYNPDGSINYDRISSFSISDMALFLSFGKRFRDTLGLSVGGSAKIIKRDYGSFANAWGFGIDVGAQYTTDDYQVGVFLQDITTTFSSWSFSIDDSTRAVFTATGNEIPKSSSEITLPSIHAGGQYHFRFGKGKNLQFNPMAKLSIFTDKRNVLLAGPLSVDMSVGGELGIYNTAFIRFGVNNFTKATNDLGEEYLSFVPSVGAGFKLQQFEIDYSYNNVANSGVGLYSHVFSATYRFKKKDKFDRPNIKQEQPIQQPNNNNKPSEDIVIPININ